MESKHLRFSFAIFLFFFSQLIHFSYGDNTDHSVVKAAYWYYGFGVPSSFIESSLFTHLYCAFAIVDPETNHVTLPSSNIAPFSTFTSSVHQKNPSVKTLLSIGGGGFDPSIFSSMASQPDSRKSFIDSSINLARYYDFDGLDLDWEFPSTPTDMSNLALLLNEWHDAITLESSKNNKKLQLLLTSAVYYSSNYFSVDLPAKAMKESLDWVNIMTYSFSAPRWSPNLTKPPAALFNPISQVSGDLGIKAWKKAGLPMKKMVLGLPFYGFAWLLVNEQNHGVYDEANGAGISENGGAMAYFQIREFMDSNNAQRMFNSTFVMDYCYFGTTWIGYDDVKSIFTKVRYARKMGLLGYFAWEVNLDLNWNLSKTASRAWEMKIKK